MKTRDMNATVKSVIVLSVITVVCVALLSVANGFWRVEVDLDALYKSVCPADSYTLIYNADSAEIKDFNKGNTSNFVSSVKRAEGGVNNGSFIIESTGMGYSQGPISILVAYNPEGLIIGYATLEVSSANNFWRTGNEGKLADAITGKTAEADIGGGAELKELTGATYTVSLGGVADAVNIANRFFKQVLLGQGEVLFEPVASGSALFNHLNAMYDGEVTEFIKLNVSTASTSYYNKHGLNGKANVSAAYFGDDDSIVIEVKTSAGGDGFGNWTLLVMFNNEGEIVKVRPTTSTAENHDPTESEALNSMTKLTALFAGLSVDDLATLQGDDNPWLDGTTSATESNNGIKAGIICALSELDTVLEFKENSGYLGEGA